MPSQTFGLLSLIQFWVPDSKFQPRQPPQTFAPSEQVQLPELQNWLAPQTVVQLPQWLASEPAVLMQPALPQSSVPCGQEHVAPEHVAPVLQGTGSGILHVPAPLQVPAACEEVVVAQPAVPHEPVGKVQVPSGLPWQVPAQVPVPEHDP